MAELRLAAYGVAGLPREQDETGFDGIEPNRIGSDTN
jgi:hypothetical protein